MVVLSIKPGTGRLSFMPKGGTEYVELGASGTITGFHSTVVVVDDPHGHVVPSEGVIVGRLDHGRDHMAEGLSMMSELKKTRIVEEYSKRVKRAARKRLSGIKGLR